MNAMMNETLNIGGALLVKLFGRKDLEVDRFSKRAGQVRDHGRAARLHRVHFCAIIGLLSAVGTALVYGLGGYLVIRGIFTIGTIVAFGSYLGSLYGALQGLANAPVEFATSMVSFERVFEVIDLPLDIAEKPDAVELHACQRRDRFRGCHLSPIESGDEQLAERCAPLRQHGECRPAVLSGTANPTRRKWTRRVSQAREQRPGARQLSARSPGSWWRWSDPAARARPPSPT